jgi:hypothetical protein
MVLAVAFLIFSFGFFSGLRWLTFMMWGSAVLLLMTVSLLVRRPHHARQLPARGSLPSGAPGAAIAMACFFGAVAWAFTVWVAYLAIVPVGFAVSRLYNELRHHRRSSP